jgi:uncharacterized protein (TIGR00251 family)
MPATEPPPNVAVEKSEDSVGFWIHVTPRARQEGVSGCHGDALRVAVKAPPVSGKANQACVAVLAQALGVRASAVDLDLGARGRRKRVRVHGNPVTLSARLAALATSG